MKVLVAVTGASGAIYAKRLLQSIDADLIITEVGKKVINLELGEDITPYAKTVYENTDLEAEPASGSSDYDAMVIVPCTMKTLSAIVHGYAHDLITRSADVLLKQNKKLILVPRETPLNLIHLKNLVLAKEAGADILFAAPGFYHRPKTIDDLANFINGKILELLGINHNLYKKWKK